MKIYIFWVNDKKNVFLRSAAAINFNLFMYICIYLHHKLHEVLKGTGLQLNKDNYTV